MTGGMPAPLPTFTALDFGQGSTLLAHSSILQLASPALSDMLAVAGRDDEGHCRLSVQGDTAEGWRHLLVLLDPSHSEPAWEEMSLVGDPHLALEPCHCVCRAVQG